MSSVQTQSSKCHWFLWILSFEGKDNGMNLGSFIFKLNLIWREGRTPCISGIWGREEGSSALWYEEN